MSKQIKIGKSSDNDYVIDNPRISRHHAVLYKDANGQLFIIDLDSTNGTRINDKRIEKPNARYKIQSGDIIKIADTLIDWQRIIRMDPEVGAKGESTTLTIPDLKGGYLITREIEGNKHITFRNPKVSSLHAIIYINNSGNVIIEDLNSTNGTFVNGSKVSTKTLVEGDVVTLTDERLNFDWPTYFDKGGGTIGGDRVGAIKPWQIALLVSSLCLFTLGGFWWSNNNKSKTDSKDANQTAVAQTNANAATTVETMRKAVFRIETRLKESGKLLGSGTGFFIDDNGKAITNYHVLYPSMNPTRNAELNSIINEHKDENMDLFKHTVILYPNGEEYRIDNYIKRNAKKDYVIITINPTDKVNYLGLEDAEPAVGTELMIIGNSGMGANVSIQNNLSYGHITSESVHSDKLVSKIQKLQNSNYKTFNDIFPEGSFFIFDGALAGGNSGGPIINKNTNKVIGIASAAFHEENFNIGIKTNKLEYLKNN